MYFSDVLMFEWLEGRWGVRKRKGRRKGDSCGENVYVYGCGGELRVIL